MDETFYNRVGNERISARQIDELVGIARAIMADGKIDQGEVEFLQTWLSSNLHITNNPLVHTLYLRVSEILADGIVDEDEKAELFDTLNQFASRDLEIGEALKATTLPLCDPAPDIVFQDKRFCFTGTFVYGDRKSCESAAIERGGAVGALTMKTNFLVIGTYATDSWKHSSFGNKILKACDYRGKGRPISIVSETHWQKYL